MKMYKLFLLAASLPFFMASQQSVGNVENSSKPLFPGCEEVLDVAVQNKCTSNEIKKFFRNNLDKLILYDLNLNGKQTNYIAFIVQEDGSVKDFQVRSSFKELTDDFIRIASLLPNFVPAIKENIAISSRIALPISFISKGRPDPEPERKIDVVPFSVIESVPVYPGCGKLKSNQAKKDCMSKKISEIIKSKFNTDIASYLGLEGRQRINVIFKISKTGEIIDIRARAPHPDLKEEAIRVIKRLPKMKPGIQKGKAVIVPYSLPIVFMVQPKKKKDPFDDSFFKRTGN